MNHETKQTALAWQAMELQPWHRLSSAFRAALSAWKSTVTLQYLSGTGDHVCLWIELAHVTQAPAVYQAFTQTNPACRVSSWSCTSASSRQVAFNLSL